MGSWASSLRLATETEEVIRMVKKDVLRSKTKIEEEIQKLRPSQLKSYHATLHSKKGAEAMSRTLRLAGSKVTAAQVRSMMKKRLDELKKQKAKKRGKKKGKK